MNTGHKFLVGSHYFFPDKFSKDLDFVIFGADLEKNEKIPTRRLSRNEDDFLIDEFLYPFVTKQELQDWHLHTNMDYLNATHLIVPEVLAFFDIDFYQKDRSFIEKCFSFGRYRLEKHNYILYIRDCYWANGSTVLTDEQRDKAFQIKTGKVKYV